MSWAEWYSVIVSTAAFLLAMDVWLGRVDGLDDIGTLGDR